MFKSMNSPPMERLIFLNHLCFIYGILVNSNSSFLFFRFSSRNFYNIYIIVISGFSNSIEMNRSKIYRLRFFKYKSYRRVPFNICAKKCSPSRLHILQAESNNKPDTSASERGFLF
jgi:hypothetical protein